MEIELPNRFLAFSCATNICDRQNSFNICQGRRCLCEASQTFPSHSLFTKGKFQYLFLIFLLLPLLAFVARYHPLREVIDQRYPFDREQKITFSKGIFIKCVLSSDSRTLICNIHINRDVTDSDIRQDFIKESRV